MGGVGGIVELRGGLSKAVVNMRGRQDAGFR